MAAENAVAEAVAWQTNAGGQKDAIGHTNGFAVGELAQMVRAKRASAGGRRGKERAARHERSSDWRRGAQRPRPGARTGEGPKGPEDRASRNSVGSLKF